MVTTLIADDGDPDDPTWMTTADAARDLGITPRTLYRFIEAGLLPATRFGRVIRVRRVDVEMFVLDARDDGF